MNEPRLPEWLILFIAFLIWLLFIPIGIGVKWVVMHSGATMITFGDIVACFVVPALLMYFPAIIGANAIDDWFGDNFPKKPTNP